MRVEAENVDVFLVVTHPELPRRGYFGKRRHSHAMSLNKRLTQDLRQAA